MAIIKVQAVFQGGSQLPEDRYVNSFHFADDQAFSSLAPVASAAVAEFYNEPGTLPAIFDALGSLLSPYVARAWETRVYDMEQAQPRVPTIFPQTLPAVKSGATATVPHEAAATLSYRGAPPVTARRRGRIYFGPMNSVCVAVGSTTIQPTLSGNVRGSLIGAATRLLAEDLGWSIWSPTSGEYVPIVGGWVDNEIDTQRRRGGEATIRTNWGA